MKRVLKRVEEENPNCSISAGISGSSDLHKTPRPAFQAGQM